MLFWPAILVERIIADADEYHRRNLLAIEQEHTAALMGLSLAYSKAIQDAFQDNERAANTWILRAAVERFLTTGATE